MNNPPYVEIPTTSETFRLRFEVNPDNMDLIEVSLRKTMADHPDHVDLLETEAVFKKSPEYRALRVYLPIKAVFSAISGELLRSQNMPADHMLTIGRWWDRVVPSLIEIHKTRIQEAEARAEPDPDPMISIQESWNKDVESGTFDPRDS